MSKLLLPGCSGIYPTFACDTVSRKVTESQVCQACDALRSCTCDIASHSPHRVQELDLGFDEASCQWTLHRAPQPNQFLNRRPDSEGSCLDKKPKQDDTSRISALLHPHIVLLVAHHAHSHDPRPLVPLLGDHTPHLPNHSLSHELPSGLLHPPRPHLARPSRLPRPNRTMDQELVLTFNRSLSRPIVPRQMHPLLQQRPEHVSERDVGGPDERRVELRAGRQELEDRRRSGVCAV